MTTFATVENTERPFSRDLMVYGDYPLLEALLNAGGAEGDEIRLLIALLAEGLSESGNPDKSL
jgi:hypothetical protein